MIKRRVVCHALAALFGLIIIAPITAMRLDFVEPIHISAVEMFPTEVRAGQTVRLTWIAHEYRACDGIIHRRFVDSAGVIFDIAPVPSIYRTELAGKRTFSRDIQIPTGMALGPAAYGGVRRYWCNPLQRLLQGWLGFEISIPAPAIRFKVIP